MKKLLIAAALAATALTGNPAAAAQLANFTIQTGLAGDLQGSPTTATITGGINYDTFFAGPLGGSSAVSNFNVFLTSANANFNPGNFSPLAGGINAVLTLDTLQTGTLNFFSGAQGSNPVFSFALSNLFTANGQGALPGGGLTLTNATNLANTTINAGSSGTLAVTAAVPEPATWAMMIGGFGVVGGAMRYRRRELKVSFATA